MLKLAGIMLLMAGCIGLGISRVAEEKGRIRELREIRQIVTRLKNEMAYGKRTLPEICRLLGESGKEPYRTIFLDIFRKTEENAGASLVSIWKEEMENGMRMLPLKEEEKDILRDLPERIFCPDEVMQAADIGQSLEMITAHILSAEAEYANKSRVIISVSVTAGIFLSILLV